MKTSYFLVMNYCKDCKRQDKIVIGFREVDWKFTFYSYGGEESNFKINSWEDWQNIINIKAIFDNCFIVDNHDVKISVHSFIDLVNNTKSNKYNKDTYYKEHPEEVKDMFRISWYIDDNGFTFIK